MLMSSDRFARWDTCPVCRSAERSAFATHQELAFVRCECGLVYKSRGPTEAIETFWNERYDKRQSHRIAKSRRQILDVLNHVEPGQLLTWPQLTPHRVTNIEGLNVSLSTEHKNARARRRINVHEANHFLRSRFPRFSHTASVDGWSAHLKQALSRGLRLHGRIFGKTKQQFVYPKTLKVDPKSPSGLAPVVENASDFVAPHEVSATADVG